jgi:hypothetical protein
MTTPLDTTERTQLNKWIARALALESDHMQKWEKIDGLERENARLVAQVAERDALIAAYRSLIDRANALLGDDEEPLWKP